MAQQKVLFIVNPISGGRKKDKIIATIEKFLDKELFEYAIAYTQYAGHGIELARDCDADIVVAVGGDGTVGEVAKGVIASERQKVLGIIPCGSGDGLALHLGISRNPRKAVETLNNHTVAKADYAFIGDKAFFSVAGVGFDADVAEAFAASGHRGLITYITTALKLWWKFEPKNYKINADGQIFDGKAVLITAGNSNQWGNNARITPLASVCDGKLDLTIVLPFKTWQIPYLATKLLTGKAHTAKGVKMLKAAHICIQRDSEGAAHFDGDPCRMGEEIEIKTIPSAILLAVPKDRKI